MRYDGAKSLDIINTIHYPVQCCKQTIHMTVVVMFFYNIVQLFVLLDRISFKIILMSRTSMVGAAPEYISELLFLSPTSQVVGP